MFDRVFVSDPSFKSTFAKKQSCRSSLPLQLLFWPNFMFQCKIWSFGRSNFDQNHIKRVPLGYCVSSEVVRAPIPRPRVVAGDATRRPSANLALRARAPVLIPTEPCPFSSTLLLPRARNEWKTSLSSSLWSIPAPVTPRRPSSIYRAKASLASPRSSSIPFRARTNPTPAESSPRPPATIVALTEAPPSRRAPLSGPPPLQSSLW